MSRVLVAEDDREMRRLVVEALRKDGHDIIEAADGGALLARLAEAYDHDASLHDVDLIVSDVWMPMRNGLELVENLFAARWRIPCVLMTAFGDDRMRRRAEAVGATLLEKPLSMDLLRVTVGRLARRAAPG